MNLIEPLLIMSPAWFSILINAAVKGFLILLAAAILAQCSRKASAAWRHLIWVLALTGRRSRTGVFLRLTLNRPAAPF